MTHNLDGEDANVVVHKRTFKLMATILYKTFGSHGQTKLARDNF